MQSFVSVLYISLLTAVFIGNLLTPLADWKMSDCVCLWHDKESNRTVMQVRIVFAPGTIYTNLKAQCAVETVSTESTKAAAVLTKPLEFQNGTSLVRASMWVLTHVVDEKSPLFEVCQAVIFDNDGTGEPQGRRRASTGLERLHTNITAEGYKNHELALRVHKMHIRVEGTDPRLQEMTETVHVYGVSVGHILICHRDRAAFTRVFALLLLQPDDFKVNQRFANLIKKRSDIENASAIGGGIGHTSMVVDTSQLSMTKSVNEGLSTQAMPSGESSPDEQPMEENTAI